MNHSIINAIQQKKLISLSYDGITRTVEPHAYGVSSKGNELLRCFQVKGDHNSDKPHVWDLLTVSKIIALTDNQGQEACDHYRTAKSVGDGSQESEIQ